jgi:hypothetical protein
VSTAPATGNKIDFPVAISKPPLNDDGALFNVNAT